MIEKEAVDQVKLTFRTGAITIVIANEPTKRRCDAGEAVELRAVRGILSILKKSLAS